MKNFKIISCDTKFKISPITDIGASLALHCNMRGDKLIYSTLERAQAAADAMDNAIENRPNRSWMIFKENDHELS